MLEASDDEGADDDLDFVSCDFCYNNNKGDKY